MKTLISILILSIAITINIHSQWLEKEGYWELGQNYGDLRDIKLNEITGELMVVTSDKNIVTIDTKTGNENKRCICELENTPFSAHISTDFNTVTFVIQKSIHELDIDSILYYTFEIKECKSLFKYSVFVKNYNGIISPSSNFVDYINVENLFIVSLGINKRWFDGPNDFTSIFGDLKIFKFENNKLTLLDSIDKPLNHMKYSKNKITTFYGTLGLYESQSWTSWGGGFSYRDSNYIAEYDYLGKQYKEIFQSGHGGSKDNGDSPAHYFGQFYDFDKIIEINEDNYLVKSYRTLFTFDRKTNKFIDSIFFNYGLNDFMIHPNNEILIYSEYKNINSLLFSNKKSIDSITYPFETLKLIYDNSNLNIILYCADQKIRYISPDIFKPIPDTGFIYNKALVYTNEQIQFSALCNIDSCEYEWQFMPGIITKTKNKNIEYTYNEPGTYSVKLTIITPDGVRHEFLKEKIIKVIDKPKVDFSYEILNNELPLKVQFTDLSKGEIIERFWDFGDGNTSTELNPTHEYNFNGDFSVKLIVKDTLGADTLIKYETILIHVELPEKLDAINNIINKNTKFEFRSSSLAKDRFHIISGSIFVEYYEPFHDYKNSNMINFLTLDRNFKNLTSKTHEFGFGAIKHCPKSYSIEYHLNDSLYIIYHTECYNSDNTTLIYNIYTGNSQKISGKFTSDNTRLFAKSKEGEIYHILDYKGIKIVVTNYELEVLSSLEIINAGNKLIFADSLKNGLNLVSKKQDNSYKYFSISPENTIKYEKSFLLDTNITLSNIKSVNNNLILLHGYYNDKVNNTSYAYFGKYHPLDNTLQDTILYSRKDIRKIERINNKWYAAIGQSRGRQGYLILDTTLHQIKDIRVDSLTGEIKDMILHDNKVYLFTEKIVSLETMALGANESYQTTASVLSLPEDIIADVDEYPVVTGKTFTHSAYPNPANDVINLKVVSEESGRYTIKLYDLLGMEISTIYDGVITAGSEKYFTIPTLNLAAGAYYYVISGGSNFGSGRVMVVR